jgi:hypothetical protein
MHSAVNVVGLGGVLVFDRDDARRAYRKLSSKKIRLKKYFVADVLRLCRPY